jgi:hypothetical protein
MFKVNPDSLIDDLEQAAELYIQEHIVVSKKKVNLISFVLLLVSESYNAINFLCDYRLSSQIC